MKGILDITINPEVTEPTYFICYSTFNHDYELKVEVAPGTNLEELLMVTDEVANKIYDGYIMYSDTCEDQDELLILTNMAMQGQIDFLSTIDTVYFSRPVCQEFDPTLVSMMIKENPVLRTKVLWLNEPYTLLEDSIEELNNQLDGENINMFFDNLDNMNLTSIEAIELEKSIQVLVDSINDSNYSPFETLMLIYDSVRQYLNSQLIFFEDKYDEVKFKASLLDLVLKKLGYKTQIDTLVDSNNKLAYFRNAVHIIDDKYNINGLYYLDLGAENYEFSQFAREKSNYSDLDYIMDYNSKHVMNDASDFANKFLGYYNNGGILNVPKELRTTLQFACNFLDCGKIESALPNPHMPMDIQRYRANEFDDFVQQNFENFRLMLFWVENLLNSYPIDSQKFISAFKTISNPSEDETQEIINRSGWGGEDYPRGNKF